MKINSSVLLHSFKLHQKHRSQYLHCRFGFCWQMHLFKFKAFGDAVIDILIIIFVFGCKFNIYADNAERKNEMGLRATRFY